jgi:hypothetical protein
MAPLAIRSNSDDLEDTQSSVPLKHGGENETPPFDSLVSSPYSGVEHQLDLSSISVPSRQLAVALTHLQPTTQEYPSQPYSSSFNWQEIIGLLPPEFSGFVI